MKQTILNRTASKCLIAMSGWVAFHLLLLCMGKEIVISEPNAWARIPEFICVLAIFGLGVERLIHFYRHR